MMSSEEMKDEGGLCGGKSKWNANVSRCCLCVCTCGAAVVSLALSGPSCVSMCGHNQSTK